MGWLRARVRSFGFALAGLKALLATQPNARIHLAATVLVVVCGVWVRLTKFEWASILIAAGMVWTAEALNTAIEFLADEVSLERRPRIKIAKDVSAFGVLASAIAAAGVGLLVILAHLG